MTPTRSGSIEVMAMRADRGVMLISHDPPTYKMVRVTVRAVTASDAWETRQPCPLAARIKTRWLPVYEQAGTFRFWSVDSENVAQSIYIIDGADALRIREAFMAEQNPAASITPEQRAKNAIANHREHENAALASGSRIVELDDASGMFVCTGCLAAIASEIRAAVEVERDAILSLTAQELVANISALAEKIRARKDTDG